MFTSSPKETVLLLQLVVFRNFIGHEHSGHESFATFVAQKTRTCCFTSRGRRVNRKTGRTAGAHGGTVGSAIGTGLGNTVGTRTHVR